MNYDVNYFIKKFEAIPEQNWITGSVGNGECHCALGHCGVKENDSQDWVPTDEAMALINIFTDEPIIRNEPNWQAVYYINDKVGPKYYQYEGDTPKARILNHLYKKAGIDKQLS